MGRTALACIAVGTVVAACCWGTVLMAQEKPAETRRIELTEPGVYKDSDCLYVMTKDVTAKGCGFTFEGSNTVVDLGGHTLTFNAEPYEAPPKTHRDFQPPWGVLLRGAGVELRNGAILQGAGKNDGAHCIFIKGKDYDIHHLTTVITGGRGSRNIYAKWGGSNVKLHHNYVVCADDSLASGIVLHLAGANWDIHHNTVVGGHTGIGGGRSSVHIHHNYISHKRTRGQKAPQGIIASAAGSEIDHNEITSIDGRGLKPDGGSNWHHNVVDVRYTLKAVGGPYAENRCYGLWARGTESGGNRITDNLFVVNNEVLGDTSSNSVGIMLCTFKSGGEPIKDTIITGNRFVVRHNNTSSPATGVLLRNAGPGTLVKDNFIWAGTEAVVADENARDVRIEGNTFVKGGGAWRMKAAGDMLVRKDTGTGLESCVFEGNKVIDPPSDKVPPAAPVGLSILRRFNGYELHWSPNAEEDVLGYYVYRDGKRLEDRLKCGRFYVDTTADTARAYSYSVSAADLAGNEGPKCAPLSTRTAK